jgi:nicotinamidase-related amidase
VGVGEVVLVGLETDACVLKTAFDAFDADYRVRVISDLCATAAGAAVHQQTLTLMRRNIGAESIVTAETYLRSAAQ